MYLKIFYTLFFVESFFVLFLSASVPKTCLHPVFIGGGGGGGGGDILGLAFFCLNDLDREC